jgi:hypothetical protein
MQLLENTINIQINEIQSITEYLDFIKENSNSKCLLTIAHNPSLRIVLSKSFGYEYKYWFIISNKEIIGVFPSFFVNGKMVSIPHFSYGGAFVKKGYEEYLDYINYQLIHFFKKSEIRSLTKSSKYYSSNKVASFISLKNEDDIFKEYKSNHRRKIKKSYKNDLYTQKGGIELLNPYYKIYSRNMYRLGSPSLPYVFFENLLKYYENGDKNIFITYLNKKPIGVAFVLSFYGFSEDCWLSTDTKYNKLYTSYQLYWEMIKDAVQDNKKIFSLGRSTKNSSLHDFKKHWNIEEQIIYFNYSQKTKHNIKSFPFLNKIWKKLPFSLTIKLSHPISKRIY